jgi:hypothetical protein
MYVLRGNLLRLARVVSVVPLEWWGKLLVGVYSLDDIRIPQMHSLNIVVEQRTDGDALVRMAERMWATYASLPLEDARKAYHAVGGAGVAESGSEVTDTTAGVTDEYRQLVRQLVPIYTYDATKETGVKSHTGVLLPDGEQDGSEHAAQR